MAAGLVVQILLAATFMAGLGSILAILAWSVAMVSSPVASAIAIFAWIAGYVTSDAGRYHGTKCPDADDERNNRLSAEVSRRAVLQPFAVRWFQLSIHNRLVGRQLFVGQVAVPFSVAPTVKELSVRLEKSLPA